MITIPECFHCIHYNNGKCPAYPEGIPYKILAENNAGKQCGENVKYIKRASVIR